MAHIPRLFVASGLAANSEFELDEGQSRYLLRVMRLETGAVVRIFNGQDGEWQCALRAVGKRAYLTPQRQRREQTKTRDLTLLFAPIKKARTDFIIEKATELGVSVIQPVITDYTQNARVRADKLTLLAIEAAEQTERMDIPHIDEAAPLKSVLAAREVSSPLYFCDEGGGSMPMQQALIGQHTESASILIGPEGGFSDTERNLLRSLEAITPVTLGPRILRAETAVVSALTLWQSQVGDWQEQPYLAKSD